MRKGHTRLDLTGRAACRGGAAAHARKRLAAATATALITTGIAALALTQPAAAASGCQISYTSSSWPGGFTASISVTNLGSPITNWTLAFTLPGNEAVSQGWSANYSQSGQNVTAANASYNGSLGTNGNTSIGFSGQPGLVHTQRHILHRRCVLKPDAHPDAHPDAVQLRLSL
jgi:cellulase/cellobiase CelA1